ncbi:MAG: aminodeoxychorismate synthase component I [Thermodesulfobacteriota bacterium]
MNFLNGVKIGRPVVRELNIFLPPESVFDRIHSMPFSFFLDSGMDRYKLGRYSFMGYAPFLILKSKGNRIEIAIGGDKYTITGNPFHIIDSIIRRYKIKSDLANPPFIGGGVGYFSYDLCHFIERLPKTVVDDLSLPDCYFCFYDRILAYDHQENRWYICLTRFDGTQDFMTKKTTEDRIRKFEEEILVVLKNTGVNPSNPMNATRPKVALESNFTRENYLKAIEKAKEYIFAGDIYQVNLSQRFHAKLPMGHYQLYKKLRSVNPAPFACYLNLSDVTIVSSSPERFLKVEGDRVQTRPIKGTRPRGKDHGEDERLKEELIKSEKDRAELNMIVDLERNDLGRVCDYGSVRVTEHAIAETYATVFHLVSTVEGTLLPRYNYIDLLKACFPGGSITGAPKIRAMEIIDELEPTARSVYTGSIGYLGFNNHIDLNIAIRTFLIKGDDVYFQVGGGIVADSTLEGEFDETLDKAKALIEALTS